jgi:hypothetical protein
VDYTFAHVVETETKTPTIMKAKLSLAAVCILICATAFAQDPAIRVEIINQGSPETFKVIYAGEKAAHVKLTILDKDKQVMFSETSPKMIGFIRKVNFAGMEAGEYTVQIEAGPHKESRVIRYTGLTSIEAVSVSKTAEPGKYLLAVKNKRPEILSVMIFDGADNLVHSEKVSSSGNLKMVYNLKGVPGLPTFQVVDRAGAVKVIRY